MRVRFRPAPATCVDCSQHPERQFTRWFTRQSAANPGFPAMVRSILLVVSGETTCPACRQSLNRFLQRFQLAHKLQVRSATPKPECACRKNARATSQPVQTELDQLLSDGAQELEGEWYKRLAAPVLAGLLTFAPPSDFAAKPVVDMTKAWVKGSRDEQERRRRIEEDAQARRKQAKKTQQETDEYRVLDEIMENEVSVVNEFTDVHAQYAIQRMLKSSNPTERIEGSEMLAAVNSSQLGGIYKEDQYWPAITARQAGMGWWQLIEKGKDAGVLLKVRKNVAWSNPLIIFKDNIRSNPQRLDPALRNAWRIVRRILAIKASSPSLTAEQLKDTIEIFMPQETSLVTIRIV